MRSLTVDIVATILVPFPGPLTVLLPWSSYSWSCLPTFAVPISHAPPVHIVRCLGEDKIKCVQLLLIQHGKMYESPIIKDVGISASLPLLYVVLKEKPRTTGEPFFVFPLETLEVMDLDHVVLPARRVSQLPGEKHRLS